MKHVIALFISFAMITLTSATVMAQSGDALSFDGIDDYVIADIADWNGYFTVEFWVNAAPGQSQFSGFFSSTNSSAIAESFQIDFSAGGELRFQPPAAPVVTVTGYPTGNWEHIAFTSDGTSVTAYVNGVEQVSVASDFSGEFQYYKLGTNRNTNQYANFQMDEFRIWNYARTQAEIQATMNTSIKFAAPGLMVSYDFDDLTGVPIEVIDVTGNGNDAVSNAGNQSPSVVPSGATISNITLAIPTVSEWGMIILALGIVIGATIMIRRRQSIVEPV